MASVRDRIELLADLFLGAAFADQGCSDTERLYVHDLLCDLLCTRVLPRELEERLAAFDPKRFDLHAAAQEFTRDPCMSKRRVLELVAYVILADGEPNVDEDAFLRALGEALGMAPVEYADLSPDRMRFHHSFIDLARVPLPSATPRA